MSQATAPSHARETSQAGANAVRPARMRISRHALGPMLMIAGVLIVAVGALTFWLRGGRYVSVDDAYVRAAKEPLTTDVSGFVQVVPVKDGEYVRRGQVLLRLVPTSYRIAVERAEADLGETALTLRAMQQDYGRMLRDVDAKQAQVRADQANYDRYSALVKSGGVTRAQYDDARFRLAADREDAAALAMRAKVQLAKLGGSVTAPVETLPAYRAAKARVDQAKLNLEDTVIRAPFSGVVTNVESVQPGMYLPAGTAAFGIVSTKRVWIEAEPKETELTWVKPGDTVTVTVDTYPGRSWKGTVQSIAPNSGSEFSVLPAENSSGNWVKVVQRIPVRIEVERKPGDPVLRAGMSVEAEIDTGHVRTLSELF